MKRRKYNEDLDFKVVDDDGETIAVLGAGRTSALSASTLAWQAEVGLELGLGWWGFLHLRTSPGCHCEVQGSVGSQYKDGVGVHVSRSVPAGSAGSLSAKRDK